MKSNVLSNDTETEVLLQEKKGRTPLVEEVNGTSPWSSHKRGNKISLREAQGDLERERRLYEEKGKKEYE